jgi:hypothetical protein
MYVMLSKRMENKGFADVGKGVGEGSRVRPCGGVAAACSGKLWLAAGQPRLATSWDVAAGVPEASQLQQMVQQKLLFLCKQNSRHGRPVTENE